MLHDKCSTPLRYERHCETCGISVPWEHVTHGYEFEKGRFVVVAEEELEALPQRKSKSIDILRFVKAGEIEPIYFDKAYYIEPEEGAERAYALLREAIERTGRVPLSKVTLKEKEHLAAILVHEGALTLQTLYYADEIAKPYALNIPRKPRAEKKEIELASELVEGYSGRPDIAEFRDEYREALMGLIKAKIEGRKVKVAPAREARKVISLMDALKKSLKEKKKTPAAKRGAVAQRKRRKAG